MSAGRSKPMPPNGNTGVFVNGRELHIMDVVALRQFMPVYAGRYWCDANGNGGFEGGPALWNVWQLAAAEAVAGHGAIIRSTVGAAWATPAGSTIRTKTPLVQRNAERANGPRYFRGVFVSVVALVCA
jgi:hypothetical protein